MKNPMIKLTAALGLIVLIAGCSTSTSTLEDKDWHPVFERPPGTPLFITEWSKVKDIGPGSSLRELKGLRWFKVPSGAILYTKKNKRYYEVAFKYTENEWIIQDVSYIPIHPRNSELPARDQL